MFRARAIEADEALAIGFASALTDDPEAHVTELCRDARRPLAHDAVGDQGGAAPRAPRPGGDDLVLEAYGARASAPTCSAS